MNNGMFNPFATGGVSDENEDSQTYALHKLTDEQTIARLATGIKKFELPEDYNFIKIYKSIKEDPETGYGEQALTNLAQIAEDRRQYPKAVEYWKENIADYGVGRNAWKQKRLDQIVKNWGRFETTKLQTAGNPTSIQFRFRNANKVTLKAQKVNVDKLLKDVIKHIESKPARVDYRKVNISNIGYRLVNEGGYVEEEVAAWEQELTPRTNHFDKIATIETPLKEPGAYLITANTPDGNTSKIVMWINNTVLVQKPLNNQMMYFTADAATGQPIGDMKLDFFGYRQEYQREGRKATYKITTKSFDRNSNRDGQVIIDEDRNLQNYQWLVTAKNAEGRFAFMGFTGIWFGRTHDATYNQTKTIGITDRPVYRPGDTVKFKAWVRRAQFDKEDTSQFAERAFTIRMNDPRGQKALEQQIMTDQYGGFELEYKIPSDATLGQYMFYCSRFGSFAGNTFRIEEYKKPEFEVSVEAPTKPVMLGEVIPVKIKANYYFGAPVTNATVKYKITRKDYSSNWYPSAPWDWCFGPGYWWFAPDTPWFPGWYEWRGCFAPYPWWYGTPFSPPEIVAEAELPINEDGTIEVNIDTILAKEFQNDTDHEYSISAEVVDQSRRTIVGSGTVLVARKPFKVYTWLQKGYYETGDTIKANFKAQTLDKKPVAGKGVLSLLKITYDKLGKPVEELVKNWSVDTNDAGEANQQLKAAAPGQYRLRYKLTDSEDHEIEGGYLFSIIGEGFDSENFRFNDIELIPDNREYQAGDRVKLQINANTPNATVLLFVRPSNGVYLPPKTIKLDGKSTVEEILVSKKDMPNFFVEAVTVSNSKVHSAVKELIVPPEKRVVNVEVLPSKNAYKPGEKATVDLKLTDFYGEPFVGTTAISVYDKSVEYISGGSNVPDIREHFWKWRRSHNPTQYINLNYLRSYNIVPNGMVGMNNLGAFGYSVAFELTDEEEGLEKSDKLRKSKSAKPQSSARRGGGFGPGGGGAPMAMNALGNAPMQAAEADMAGAGMGFGGGGVMGGRAMSKSGKDASKPLVEAKVRSKFADTAFWKGRIDTDEKGIAQVKLDMPENLTSWKINVWAMGHGTKVGYGNTEVVTRKDLLVRLQAPRYFIEKDKVTLSAIVHNYLETEKQVQVGLEMPGDFLTTSDPDKLNITVPANGEQRVDWMVDVRREGTATVRMLALTDEESDAMEMKFPVHVHGILKTESWAGTVRPEQDRSIVKFIVPEERRPDQSVLEVRYSPTLAGAMVDALPYLSEYPYGCTEQTLNRWLPTLITLRTLQRMNIDLKAIQNKRTNLNAQEIGNDVERAKEWKRYKANPVFDIDKVNDMIDTGVQRLADMQVSDGGWGWFSGWGEQSYPHTTATVVRGLLIAKQNDIKLPPRILDKGIAWLKSYQDEQIQLLKNRDEDIKPNKPHASNLDSLIYMILTESGNENDIMREYLYRDRAQVSVYALATFGIGLHYAGDEKKLKMILKNIDQYLVQDNENESAYLKLPENNYWWYWYGSDNEANAYYLKLLSLHNAGDIRASRLVKYLLNNRKHGTYWRSTRDTALCVEAFEEYLNATKEAEPDMVVELWLDGKKRKQVEINSENIFSFDNKLVLTGDEVTSGEHLLEIRKKGIGSVYHNTYLTNFTLEDYITKAGLEVKVDRKYYKLTRVEKEVEDRGNRGQVLKSQVEKYERTELKDLDTVKSGDLIEVELSLESKNDYEYLLFEDMKPAGFEAVEVRSGYSNRGLRSYVEYRDDRVSFFIARLARGKNSVNYRLRAEIPGRFSALPAQASAMYAPELRGNSDEIKLNVIDR